MFLQRLRLLAQTVGFVVMGLLMIAGAVSLFKYADHALGASEPVEVQSVEAALLQQQETSVPSIMNYSGELRNSDNQLVSGTYTMTFRIYDDHEAEVSEALWEEERGGIMVQNGRFSLVLGESTPLLPSVFSGDERYFGMSVTGEDGSSPISEDTPSLRKRFALVPFAAQAGSADRASALSASDGNPQDAVYVNAEGSVGVGTANPDAPLHVHSTVQDRGLRVTAEGKDTTVWLHVADGDYGFLDLGGNTKLRGNGQRSVFSGAVGIGTANPNAPLHVHSTVQDRGLRVTAEGKDTTVWLHVADGDYGFPDLGGNTKLRGNGQRSVFSGRVSVLNIDITEGGDLAETFVITGAQAVEPGTVVAIDPDHPGGMRVVDSPYEPLIAGVISGAGDLQPGLILNQAEISDDTYPIALAGRVYVKAVGPVRIGDLLTSSNVPGHAMTATDRERAFGTTIGKAMSALDEETGLVLVLVALQ